VATITIRNLDDSVKQRLRVQAASHNRSMEEEVRIILQDAVQKTETAGGIGRRIHRRFKEAGGISLPEQNRKQDPRKPEIV